MTSPLTRFPFLTAFACVAIHVFSSQASAQLNVVSTSPARNVLTAPVNSPISVTFDRPVNLASVNSSSFRVFARWSGAVIGTFSFSNANQTVTLTPNAPFKFSAGETVMVNLSHDLQAADNSFLRPAGYSWQFWTRTRPACMSFVEIDTFSNRPTPATQTRIYGAAGCDLNRDGWLDIITVNEVSADLRVCLNRADGTGLFHPFLPPAPGLSEMSPNEPGDFNNDGFPDLCVASTATDRILVFLGIGNGNFHPAQIITVGDQPLGVAVLDLDGDGDTDIVNGNLNSNNLSRLINNGSGVFAPPIFFDAGVNGEYGIAAAEMDNDGILDIVAGGNWNQTMSVLHSNGTGTFSLIGTQNSGGQVWQVGVGDVNGDGFNDVHTANSFSQNGSILRNTGNGNLMPPVTKPTGGHTAATDLGDFDGDGDLDWLLSSFGAGIWRLHTNNGAGTFTATEDFAAPNNPSCGTCMDFNNDGFLDIVLLDEIADVVILMKNQVRTGDTNCDNFVNVDDLLNVINSWGRCGGGPVPCAAADMAPPPAGNGFINVDDLLVVINNWG